METNHFQSEAAQAAAEEQPMPGVVVAIESENIVSNETPVYRYVQVDKKQEAEESKEDPEQKKSKRGSAKTAAGAPARKEVKKVKSSRLVSSAEYTAFQEGKNFGIILESVAEKNWDGAPLEEDRVYHLKNMTGMKLYGIQENRDSYLRAYKMFQACRASGMTTPAVVVRANIVAKWGLHLIDMLTREEVDPETLGDNDYCIMEGHGRMHAWMLSVVLAMKDGNETPFDYPFVFRDYPTPEAFGKAYISTNADMTRTTQKDRLEIAAGRCQNPLVKEYLRKIREDHVIAKAANFSTYGRELNSQEVTALTEGSADAPQFDTELSEALQKCYEVFKDAFRDPGAAKIYRGVSAAQWVADTLKSNPGSITKTADLIVDKVRHMNRTIYSNIITAATNKKEHITRDAIIKRNLDDLMKN